MTTHPGPCKLLKLSAAIQQAATVDGEFVDAGQPFVISSVSPSSSHRTELQLNDAGQEIIAGFVAGLMRLGLLANRFGPGGEDETAKLRRVCRSELRG